jgi:hypothetical protein
MDLLLNIPTTKVTGSNDFDIVVENIQNGWMQLQMGISLQKHHFRVSYLCEPLNDLLESTVQLLVQPIESNCTHCKFELESQGILQWLLRKVDTKLYVYLWHNNMYEDDLMNLYHSDFDSEKHQEFMGLDFEGFPKFEEGLIFAIVCNLKEWAQIVITAFEQLNKKYDPQTNEGEWGVVYNKDNFEKLINFIIHNS